MKQTYFLLYIALAVTEILAEYVGWTGVKLITKPLLMPALVLLLLQLSKDQSFPTKKLLIVSLFFSWLGDVALMFVEPLQIGSTAIAGSPHFFLAGLVAFLIAHILYIAIFSKTEVSQKAVLLQKPLLAVPLAGYMIVLMAFVLPALVSHPVNKAMTVPVLVYSSVIGAMVVFAINRYDRVNYESFRMVLFGAVLFMVSDSIIATNAFIYLNKMPLASPAIMTTYITSQLLIVLGVIKQYNK